MIVSLYWFEILTTARFSFNAGKIYSMKNANFRFSEMCFLHYSRFLWIFLCANNKPVIARQFHAILAMFYLFLIFCWLFHSPKCSWSKIWETHKIFVILHSAPCDDWYLRVSHTWILPTPGVIWTLTFGWTNFSDAMKIKSKY